MTYSKNINWSSLSSNSSNQAIQILIDNYEKIDWHMFCCNTNTNAIKILYLASPEKIDWFMICNYTNTEIIKLLCLKYPEQINWWVLSGNISIFYDTYKNYKFQYFRNEIAQEFIAYIWHPHIMHIWINYE